MIRMNIMLTIIMIIMKIMIINNEKTMLTIIMII
jgi:hypothetical protein